MTYAGEASVNENAKIGRQEYLPSKAGHDRRSHMPKTHCLSLKINAGNWEVTPATSCEQHIFLPILTSYHIKHEIATICPILTPYLLANSISYCPMDSCRYELDFLVASCTPLSRYYVCDFLGWLNDVWSINCMFFFFLWTSFFYCFVIELLIISMQLCRSRGCSGMWGWDSSILWHVQSEMFSNHKVCKLRNHCYLIFALHYFYGLFIAWLHVKKSPS